MTLLALDLAFELDATEKISDLLRAEFDAQQALSHPVA